MTHSIDTPFPPPPATGTGATSPTAMTTTSSSPSTGDVAKDEARNLGQTAAQAGSQVASTAADQAQNVVQETKYQAQDLMAQGREQLRSQAVSQQQKAGQSLTSLAEQLRSMVQGNAPAPGPARDLLEQGAGKVEEFASFLQNREPADLLDEVRRFARRRPGTFLLGAALAGVVAGRLTSGVKAAHTDSGPSTSGSQYRVPETGYPATTNYVDPAPAYSSGYATTGTATTGYTETGYSETGYTETATTGSPLPPPPYGTTPPAGSVVPPTTPAGWDDPSRTPGHGVG
ncbi:hypothetical protein [Blastococcus sp. SYSU D00820]